MASLDSFPGPSGAADATEAGKSLAGLVVKSAAGVPRAGVFPRDGSALITGRADLKVDVGIFESALVRSGAVRFSGNDSSVTVPASPLTAPVANTKYAVFYQKQNETGLGGDTTNLSVIDAVQGAANASLTTALADARSLLPAGALELGHVALTPGATATNALVITQTAPFTAAAGGVVWVRNATDLTAWTPSAGAVAWRMDTEQYLNYMGPTIGWIQASGKPDIVSITPNTSGGISAGTPAPRIVVQNGRNNMEGRLTSASTPYTAGTTYGVVVAGGIPTANAPKTEQRFICMNNFVFYGELIVGTDGSIMWRPASTATVALTLNLDGFSWPLKSLV